MAENFSDYCGIMTIWAKNGKSRLSFHVEKHHLNLQNTIHGGMLFALMDHAGGVALFTMGRGYSFVTLSSNIYYLANVSEGDVFADGNVVRCGKTTALVEVSITDAKGRLLCKGQLEFYFL